MAWSTKYVTPTVCKNTSSNKREWSWYRYCADSTQHNARPKASSMLVCSLSHEALAQDQVLYSNRAQRAG